MPRRDLPRKIVAIGASTCFGKGDSLGGGFIGRFKQWYENDDEVGGNSVYNLGIPGDTVVGMLKRIKEVEIRKPQLIILHTGCNDCLREGSREAENRTDIKKYKRTLVNLLKKLKLISKVIIVSTFPVDELRTRPVEWADHYYLNEDIRSYSNVTANIATKLEIPLIDIMNDWLDKEYVLFLYSDGLHANANGHEYIFLKLRDKFLSSNNLNINL
jgi:lysophospholipase L1-like esterase